MLEEDMALANIGLDLLGQARAKEGFGSRVPGIAVAGSTVSLVARCA